MPLSGLPLLTSTFEIGLQGVYLGCLENKGGFFPIRDPASKW